MCSIPSTSSSSCHWTCLLSENTRAKNDVLNVVTQLIEEFKNVDWIFDECEEEKAEDEKNFENYGLCHTRSTLKKLEAYYTAEELPVVGEWSEELTMVPVIGDLTNFLISCEDVVSAVLKEERNEENKEKKTIAKKFLKRVEELMNPVMEQHNMCCAASPLFRAVSETCAKSGCEETIDADDLCIVTNDGRPICMRCAKQASERYEIDNGMEEKVRKLVFGHKNWEPETMAQCPLCGKKTHTICANWKGHCKECQKTEGVDEKKQWKAEEIPTSIFSEFLEMHVQKALSLENVFIRPLSTKLVATDIPEVTRECRFVEKPPTRTEKTLLAFRKEGGKVICFFAIIVSEYEKNAGKSVFCIDYIDSVSVVPQIKGFASEILTGTLEYARRRKFEEVHLFSCPPVDVYETYLFPVRPIDQALLGKKSLFRYYERILNDARKQKIVKESIVWDSSKIASEDLQNIPYCEGGLWALLLERYLENEVKIEEPKENQETEEEPKAKRRRPTRSTRHPSDLFADRLKEWIKANESDLCEDKAFKVTLRKTEESLAQDEVAALDAPSSIAKRGYVSIMADNFCEFSTARRAEKSTEHLVKMFFDEQERAKVQYE